MHQTKKRKRHSDNTHKRGFLRHNDQEGYEYQRRQPEQDPMLFIQAHEADLRRGVQAEELAASLEVVEYIDTPTRNERPQVRPRIGRALIHWAGGSGPPNSLFDGDEEETISLGAQKATKDTHVIRDESGIWVDRYDARLLLDALPSFATSSGSASVHATPSSPSGWSDLPSDTEETFLFSPEEAVDYRNEKRRRLLEQAHEERVKALLEEENEMPREAVDDDPWGGSDEEPDDAQKELMRRTAAHLVSSPNPAQLEMRILANHGADKRFSFLKGRWGRSWRLVKAKFRIEREEKERKEKQEKEQKGLGILTGYESGSDAGSDSTEDPKADGFADKKELRRQRAREWAEQRRQSAAGVGAEEEV